MADDLADAKGLRTVILITDGEETCGGDPEAEIVSLRAQGFDVRVNIVGFAVDDTGLKETFQKWAKTGGGEYFDAANAEELGELVSFGDSGALPRFGWSRLGGGERYHRRGGGHAYAGHLPRRGRQHHRSVRHRRRSRGGWPVDECKLYRALEVRCPT